MPRKSAAAQSVKSVEAFVHDEATRKNIPSAEQRSIVQEEVAAPRQSRYPRNTDLDPRSTSRRRSIPRRSSTTSFAPPKNDT
jgi:adenine-specific DNA-methyltransferase